MKNIPGRENTMWGEGDQKTRNMKEHHVFMLMKPKFQKKQWLEVRLHREEIA